MGERGVDPAGRWSLDVRWRTYEAQAVIAEGVANRGDERETLDTDEGTAFTSGALPVPGSQSLPSRTPPRRLPRPQEPGVHTVTTHRVFRANAARLPAVLSG
jgi:hypothetical protein